MDTLPHTRVIQHLSRFSLSDEFAGNPIASSSEKPRFYLILGSTGHQRSPALVDLALAFGCSGVIAFTGDGISDREQKDAEIVVGNNTKEYVVEDMAEAVHLLKEKLQVTEIVGVISSASKSQTSVPVSHPKAFSRSMGFVFLGDDGGDNSPLATMCDRLIHVHPSLSPLSTEACASIVFFRFSESSSSMVVVDPTVNGSVTQQQQRSARRATHKSSHWDSSRSATARPHSKTPTSAQSSISTEKS